MVVCDGLNVLVDKNDKTQIMGHISEIQLIYIMPQINLELKISKTKVIFVHRCMTEGCKNRLSMCIADRSLINCSNINAGEVLKKAKGVCNLESV